MKKHIPDTDNEMSRRRCISYKRGKNPGRNQIFPERYSKAHYA